MTPPETKFAQSGEASIAYQVLGQGPLDLVMVPGFVSHVEYAWEDPSYAPFLQQPASLTRLMLFDKRGAGLSDRITGIPTLEQRMAECWPRYYEQAVVALDDAFNLRVLSSRLHVPGRCTREAGWVSATIPCTSRALALRNSEEEYP